ncbi:hypothetical protein ACFPMF_13715 [Larkinella bovis]|uniref:DUF2868 domain-containing protein n=1 Tax=Larkinella bovis TaxID=683041 RepID=A0ABW0IG88_9BACT
MSDSTDSTGDFDQASAGRTTLRYLARAMHTDHPSDEPFVLNTNERQTIYRIKGGIMLVTSALGVLGIWAFYLPHVLWTDWFVETHTAMGDWPLISILFALLVLYVLWHALILVHTGAIRLVEITCQFPRYHDSAYPRHVQQLAENSPQRPIFRLRLRPRPLLPWTLGSYLMTILLLAFGSNSLLQLLLHLWGEKPVSNFVMVLTSTLVVAVWMGWATHQILQQAQIRVMVPLTIRQFTNELVEEFGRDPAFRHRVATVLSLAGVSGKPATYPHLLLLEALTNRFLIEPDKMPVADLASGSEQLLDASAAVRQGLERLFMFTILIDGHLSSPERQQLRLWQKAGMTKTSLAEAESMRRKFVRGEGLWV